MPPSLHDTQTALLAYLGIELVPCTHRQRDGTLLEEMHVFAEPEIIGQVLQWSAGSRHAIHLRVFEGEAPPF